MKKPKFIPEFDDIPTSRVRMPELPLEKRDPSLAEPNKGRPGRQLGVQR